MSRIERFLEWLMQRERHDDPPVPATPEVVAPRHDLPERLAREQERVEQRRRQHWDEVEQMLSLAEAEVLALKVDGETAGRFYEPPARRNGGSDHGHQPA